MKNPVFLILLLTPLAFYGSKTYSQVNLNDIQEREKNAKREYGIACQKQLLKANYHNQGTDMLVEDDKVFRGIRCNRDVGYLGYKGWKYLGEIDKVKTEPCYSGNIQYQWTLKNYGKKYTKLVRLIKVNQCKYSQLSVDVDDLPVYVDEEYYPVKWSCSKINYKRYERNPFGDGLYCDQEGCVSDPYGTGMDCSWNKLR